ncbi:transposase [Streptomyces sp. XY431]|uniref:transposase n=1 Tax=Streptomyces sp. XY431 TaxID=1415562 RepID=UPI000A923C1A|nr:transposase [Streptomyces sp. XY431]
MIEPYLPIGDYGPYPERLRQQFEGVIWRFRTGGQWREMPMEFGAWSTELRHIRRDRPRLRHGRRPPGPLQPRPDDRHRRSRPHLGTSTLMNLIAVPR